MKSMNDGSNNDGNGSNDNNNNHNHNWLGFSLSPHMKMEVTSSGPPLHHHDHHQYHHHPPQASSAAVSSSVPTAFCLSPSQLSTYGLCYGAAENAAFHSPLTVMPLKSDGSLCIMEALTRSQTQGMGFFALFYFSLFKINSMPTS